MRKKRRQHKLLFAGGSEAGGGLVGHGIITAVNCDAFFVTIDPEADTSHITDCLTFPDTNYEGNVDIYDPCPDRHGKIAETTATEEELVGLTVLFYRAANVYSCEDKYWIHSICYVPGCDDEET